MAYQDDILERLAEMAKQRGQMQEDYTIGDLSSIMISPNEISNVLYATNA